MHRFRVAGEYFDSNGDGAMISGGSFETFAMAKRAVAAVRKYMNAPLPGKLPDDLMEVAIAADPSSLEIDLYARKSDSTEEWVMSFDAETGEPMEVTPDAEIVWALLKRTLRRP
jgi:hypothetical protein